MPGLSHGHGVTKDDAVIPEVLPALSAALPGHCVLWWGHLTFTVLISGTLRRSLLVAGQPSVMPQSLHGTSTGSPLHPAPTAAQPITLRPTEWLLPLHSSSPLSNELSRLSGPGLLESSHTPADFKPVIIPSTAPLNCHWLFPAFLPLFFSFP